jgi:hypothetical protein
LCLIVDIIEDVVCSEIFLIKLTKMCETYFSYRNFFIFNETYDFNINSIA